MTKKLILGLAAAVTFAAPAFADDATSRARWLSEGGPRGIVVAPTAHTPTGRVRPTDAYALQPRAYAPIRRSGPKSAL